MTSALDTALDTFVCNECGRSQLAYHETRAPQGLMASEARMLGWALRPIDARTLCPFCRTEKRECR